MRRHDPPYPCGTSKRAEGCDSFEATLIRHGTFQGLDELALCGVCLRKVESSARHLSAGAGPRAHSHDESALTLWQSHVCVLLIPTDDISERLDLGVFLEIGNKALNLTRELVVSGSLVVAAHSGAKTLSHATVVRVSPSWLSTS